MRAELHAGIFSALPLTIVKGVSGKTESTVYPNCGHVRKRSTNGVLYQPYNSIAVY